MANHKILTRVGAFNKPTLVESQNETFDFSSLRIGASQLQVQETGGAFDFGAVNLLSSATPASANHLVNKSYVDLALLTGGRVKEAVLVAQQLSVAQGITAAEVFFATAAPVADDTVVLKNVSVTETFTFKASESVAFEVAIGASAATAMQALAQAINDDSTAWSAVWVADELDHINAGGVVVVYEKTTAAGASTSRIYGVWATQANAKVVQYNGQSEYNTEVASVTLPAVDPAAVRFGLRRQYSAITNGELHLALAADVIYSFDKDANAGAGALFTMTGPASIPDATSGSGGATKGKVTFDSSKGLAVVSGVAESKVDGTSIGFNGSGQHEVKDNGITAAKIATDAVTTTKIQDDAVTAGKIATDAVTTGKIQNSAVTTAKIADEAVTQAKRDFAVTKTNDNAGSITVRQIVYLKTNGNVDLALATNTAFGEGTKFGIVQDTTIASAASGKIVFEDDKLVGGFSGLTIGDPVFLSRSTAGAVTQSLSGFTSGDSVILLGYAESATELRWSPNYEYAIA